MAWSEPPKEVMGHLMARPRGGRAKHCWNYKQCHALPYGRCLRCGVRFCDWDHFGCRSSVPPCALGAEGVPK